MTQTAQTIIALGIVLCAVLFLVWRARKKAAASCGKGGCGCGTRKAT